MITGTSAAPASSTTRSWERERIAIAWTNREMTRPMSPIDSPLLICSSSLRNTIGVPPSSATPTSKETRVLVDGCSKISATDLPANESAPSAGRPAFSAAARVSSASSRSAISAPVMKSGGPVGSVVSVASAGIEARHLTPAAPRGHRHRGPCERPAAESAPIIGVDGSSCHHLESVPRPRPPAGAGAADLALPPAADHRARGRPCPGQPRPVRGVRGDARRGRVGRRPAAGVPAALGRAPCDRLRGRRPPRPDQPQPSLPGHGASARGDLEPGPDRLLGGRLQPDPRPYARRRAGSGARSGAASAWRPARSAG